MFPQDYEKVVDVKESEQGYGFNTFVEKTYSKDVSRLLQTCSKKCKSNSKVVTNSLVHCSALQS